MQLTSTIMVAALSLAAGVTAWTKDSKGVWTANNNFYRIGDVWAHESCTRMNTETILTSGECAFWTNAQAGLFRGHCTVYPGQVLCL